ncbi:MAG: hypothetical protein QW057_09600 [Candidatus Bathyarchaeia archaeon]
MPNTSDDAKRRERVLRLIHLCRTVRERGVDPFEVDVKDRLEMLDKYLPGWEALDDLSLDAEALNKLAAIVELQGGWVKYRSSLLYVDPLLVEFKVRTLDVKTLFLDFVRAWRPILENEQLSPQRVKEAVEYWNRLPSLAERFRRLPNPPWSRPSTLSLDEMLRLGIFSAEEFEQLLTGLSAELRDKAEKEGFVRYWDFIYAETYEETVKRAYLTSFLVTYGYAQLELRGLEEEAYLKPTLTHLPSLEPRQPRSAATAVNYETWLRMAEARRLERRVN